MAADVITRFKLETTQYESKLRDAAKGLSEYTKTATNAGKEFDKFTQKNVEAAKALGSIATSATNSKEKTKELVGAFNEAAKAYNQLTKEQQQSDFGKAMAASLTQLQQRIKETKAEMQGLKDVSAKGGFSGGALQVMAGNLMTKGSLMAFEALKGAVRDNIATARDFEVSMSQLSSLTGMVGQDLDKLKGYAIELGASTTLSASQVADAFKLIGSQQPQLLSSGEALKAVTKNAITLAEAAGIELTDAAKTLSVSINQMGGDSSNAERYINVLAAASQKGAGDIVWLGEAITKSGTTAKAVGTDYEELVANLEQLAKAGYDASTAGTALRSIIMNLEKQANNDFKPSIVGLTQAFENLGKANLSIVDYQQIAGKMFAAQAKALAEAAGEAKNMTVAITGTNTAEEQAKINTDNLDGSLKSLASAWEGLNLHLNASNGYLRDVVDWLKDVVVWADKALVGLGEVTGNRDKLNNESGGGQTKVDRQINTLSKISTPANRTATYNRQVEYYWRYINSWEKKLKEAENRKDVFAWETLKKQSDISTAKANIDGAKSMLKEYQNRASKLLTSPSPSGKTGSVETVKVDMVVDTEEATKNIQELQNKIKELKKLRDEAANKGDTKLRDQYNSQIKSTQAEIKALRGTSTTTKRTKTEQTELQQNQKKINELTEKYVQLMASGEKGLEKQTEEIRNQINELQKRNGELKMFAEQAQGRMLLTASDINMQGLSKNGGGVMGNPFAEDNKKTEDGQSLKLVLDEKTMKAVLKDIRNKSNETTVSLTKEIGSMAGGISTMASGLAQLGVELPEGMKDVITGIQGVTSILSGIATIVSAIQVISTANTIIPFFNGGIVRAAEGFSGIVPGTQFSGDNIPILANAGEVVLNKAQTAALASDIQSGGSRSVNVRGVLKGEDIVLIADRWGMRTGRGELVFGKNL